MKILFINTVFGHGSTGKIVKELGEAVEAQNGEYCVVYGRGNSIDSFHTFFIGNKVDRIIHAGLSRVTDRTGFYSTGATKKLIQYIREYNPNIIHLHNLHGYYINIEVLLTYIADEFPGKVVWTLHDCWSFTGHCTYYSFAQCDKWQTGCDKCFQKREYPSSFLTDSSKRNYAEKKYLISKIKDRTTFVTVSKWLEKEAKKSFLKDCNIMTIYNGVDTELFVPTFSDIRKKYDIGDKYMFLCISDGWDYRKGYEKILELNEHLNEKSVIVVIGLSKKQIRNLPKNIIGLERTWNQRELIEFYCAADVLFNPSKEETFGLVTAESMACGTPAIVFNTTACPEVVGDERCGFIMNDIELNANNLKYLFIKKEEKSSNCRNRAEEMFSITRMKEEYLELYKSILQ